MDTLTNAQAVERKPAPRTWTAAAAAVAGGAATTIYGVYGDPHPSASQEHGVPFVVGAGIVVAALVFGLLVPWAAKRTGRSAGWGLALGIVALVTIPVMFWSGVNVIIGGAALVLGLTARRTARTGVATAATVIATVTIVASTVLVVLGNTVLA